MESSRCCPKCRGATVGNRSIRQRLSSTFGIFTITSPLECLTRTLKVCVAKSRAGIPQAWISVRPDHGSRCKVGNFRCTRPRLRPRSLVSTPSDVVPFLRTVPLDAFQGLCDPLRSTCTSLDSRAWFHATHLRLGRPSHRPFEAQERTHGPHPRSKALAKAHVLAEP